MPATVEMPDRENGGTGVAIQLAQDLLEFKDMLFMKMTDIDQVQLPLLCQTAFPLPLASSPVKCTCITFCVVINHSFCMLLPVRSQYI